MKRAIATLAAIVGLAFVASLPAAAADYHGRKAKSAYKYQSVKHHRKSAKRYGPRVRGFYMDRRGGYSYSYPDTINTYGDSRSLYGAAGSFRDPMLDRQTNAGPFDHGFFFDSGIAPRGGNSPYMN